MTTQETNQSKSPEKRLFIFDKLRIGDFEIELEKGTHIEVVETGNESYEEKDKIA